jgi:hypothetical protein
MIIENIIRRNLRSALRGKVNDDMLEECVNGMASVIMVYVREVGAIKFIRIVRDLKSKWEEITKKDAA